MDTAGIPRAPARIAAAFAQAACRPPAHLGAGTRARARGRCGTVCLAHTRRAAGPAQTPFLGKTNHPSAWSDDAAFAAFLACNDPAIAAQLKVGERTRLGRPMLEYLDAAERGEGAAGVSDAFGAIARELALTNAMDSKEFFEGVEFYQRVRKRVRRPVVLDLACGHGFVGLLFAALERSVEKVTLLRACVCTCVGGWCVSVFCVCVCVCVVVGGGKGGEREEERQRENVYTRISPPARPPARTRARTQARTHTHTHTHTCTHTHTHARTHVHIHT